MAPGHSLTGIELMLDDPMRIEPVRAAVTEALPGFIVTDWRETYGPLFANLQLQTVSLFVVLSLIVMVSSFQVSSSLVILTINKRRTCGMIQALGGAPAFVRRALVLAGVLLGGCGVAAGMLLGAVASFLLSHFRIVRFPEGLAQVYRVDHIDFLVQPTHLVAIAGVCAVLILLASFWPAWRASRMDPVKALKAV
jgi:lipoprotein-releasing system permease protein